MNAYERLLELKTRREEYVRISQENNMWDGTKKILTDMYPDTAHFVYELLQNAEDMCASEVRFMLDNDKLVFVHNGKKRDFIFEDIDSITSIGNNTLKKDDPTSIGTFGVGFKAVYTYTSTPEIHSGEYDFRIRDMVIPDPENVPKTAKTGVTKFIFPFDHKTKMAKQAIAEIKSALLELDENSILFLNHIEKISFKLPNGSVCGIQIKKLDNVLRIIDKFDVSHNEVNTTKSRTYWFKFSKNCNVKTVKGPAILPISIAFKMNMSKEGETIVYTVDETLKGKVFIYFPAIKEHSNLHFHIHAPFASTVARDSVRDCEENNNLIQQLASLAVMSIAYFKERKCLDYHYYAAMPNKRDFIYGDTKYKIFYDEIINAFKKRDRELIITESGDYKSIDQVKQGNREIVRLINSEDFYELYKKYWVPALVPQTREETFLNEIGLTQYDRRNIIATLQYSPDKLKPFFQKKIDDNEWFVRFYELLNGGQISQPDINILKTRKIIKCNDGELHSAEEGLYLKSDYVPKLIINPLYVEVEKNLPKGITEGATTFLHSLGVRTMTEEIDLMYELRSKQNVETDDVVIILLEIIEKYRKNENIEQFKESAIILGRKMNGDGKLYRIAAKKCCWSKEVAFFYENIDGVDYTVAKEYYHELNNEEMAFFEEVFVRLGGKVAPEIVQCKVDRRHHNWKKLNTSNIRISETNKDYTITGLENIYKIPERELYSESLILWKVVVNDKNIKHHEAVFSANSSRSLECFDSRVAYVLKNAKWIPNKKGLFCRPCEITADELYEGFEYNEDAVFLKNIGFGDITKAPDNVITNLENAGIEVSDVDKELLGATDEEKEAMTRFLKAQREQSKRGKSLTLTEALDDESKPQSIYYEEEDYERDISVKNPSARAKKLQEDFEAGLEKSNIRKPVLKYTYDSKTSMFEKQFVKEQYRGKCQICGREPIRKYNGDIYFEAINIINTDNLNKQLLNNIHTGWNTLCLCPICAVEYRYCAKNLDTFEDQVEHTFVEPSKNEHLLIQIQLKGKPAQISFTPKHFIALKSAFKVYKEYEDKN